MHSFVASVRFKGKGCRRVHNRLWCVGWSESQSHDRRRLRPKIASLLLLARKDSFVLILIQIEVPILDHSVHRSHQRLLSQALK